MELNTSSQNQDLSRIAELEKELSQLREEISNINQDRKTTENNSERYYDVLMGSPFAFSIMKGKNMEITLANKLIKEIWGKGDEVEGKTLLEVLPELKDQSFPGMLDSVYTTGQPVSANEILALINYNGKTVERYFNVVYYPLIEAGEIISGVITIANEVTEQVLARKKIEESEYRYHNLIYSSPSMIAIFKGRDMIIEIANDAILESWGKGKNIIGKSLFEVMPEAVEQGFDKILLKVYQTGEHVYVNEKSITLLRNGKKELMHYSFVYQAQRDMNDVIEGVAVIANEVSPQVEAKNKLKESEKRLRNLVEQAPTPILILKGEQMIMEVANQPAFRIFNVGKESLGKPFLKILPEMKDQPFIGMLLDVYRSGITQYGNEEPAYFIRKNGEKDTVYFNFVYQPYYEDEGIISGVMVLANDVTEQVLSSKNIKESERHFRLMADLMPAKISHANLNGEVTYFNSQWLEYSGYSFEELRDFGYHKMLHSEEIEEFQNRLLYATQTGTVLEMEMRFLNKKGEYKWHLNLAAPVKDENGNVKSWVGVTTEMQQQKEHREELEKTVKNRTLELREANILLQDKNEELINMNTELESFTYITSHDLQEPLRKIQIHVSKILISENALLSEKGKEDFIKVQVSAKRMQALIQDLLSYSTSMGIDLKFEKTDLKELIQEVINDYKEIVEEKNIIIESNNHINFSIVPFQFKQIIHNLIDNSLKFARSGNQLHILIKSEIISGSDIKIEKKQNKFNPKIKPKTNYCHLTVSDNGIGFDSLYKDKIFEVFQRLHNKDEYPGTGIGLSIIKKIIENHNGIIHATGEVNQGASFKIYIPEKT